MKIKSQQYTMQIEKDIVWEKSFKELFFEPVKFIIMRLSG